MKYAKLLRTACLAAALVCGAAVGNAKNGVVPKMYMFGFAASFSDSIVHFTDVQELKDVWIDTKTDFLLGRDGYSYQLRDYLAGKNMGHRTCVVVFNKSRKKLEKELQKMKELYGPAKDGKQYYDVRHLSPSDFSFKTISFQVEESDGAPAAGETAKQEPKKAAQ